MKRIPIVIDCDTGTDDAVCITAALLHSELLDIRAVTCVCGNVGVDKSSRNTLAVLDFLGSSIPVAVGAYKPLRRELTKAISHGNTGLGDVVLPESRRRFLKKPAWDVLYDEAVAAKGALEILAVGPLTNLALAITKYPDFAGLIKRITIMGGALTGGNITMTGEFNIYNDPDAARIVFQSKVELVMVGLDVTLKPRLPAHVLRSLQLVEGPYANLCYRILDFMVRRKDEIGGDDPNLHDVIALVAIVAPSLLVMRNVYVDIETEGELTLGMTVADLHSVTNNAPNVYAAVDIDIDGFWHWFIELFSRKRKGGKP